MDEERRLDESGGPLLRRRARGRGARGPGDAAPDRGPCAGAGGRIGGASGFYIEAARAERAFGSRQIAHRRYVSLLRRLAPARALLRVLASGAAGSGDRAHGDRLFVQLFCGPLRGAVWCRRGEQVAIPTPGKNRKRYLAGALDAHRGTVVYTEGDSKDTDLFLRLLEAVERKYDHRFRRLYIVLDNYGIHSSRIARAWVAHHPRIRLLFQPAYHPWVNAIERLWKAMHDTVTRNHHHATLDQLMHAVRRFLYVVQPFPGNKHGLATA